MLEFGPDIILDLLQFYQFDMLGWLLGRVDARPEFVLCMVEGLPSDSRYKIGSLPNPAGVDRAMVEYEASTAHTNTLLSQALGAFAGKDTDVNKLMPSWAKADAGDRERSHGGNVRSLHAALMGGLPASS